MTTSTTPIMMALDSSSPYPSAGKQGDSNAFSIDELSQAELIDWIFIQLTMNGISKVVLMADEHDHVEAGETYDATGMPVYLPVTDMLVEACERLVDIQLKPENISELHVDTDYSRQDFIIKAEDTALHIEREYREEQKEDSYSCEARPLNDPELERALTSSGADRVEVSFSGSGDDGGADDWTYYKGENECRSKRFKAYQKSSERDNTETKIEDWVYSLAQVDFNNQGGGGHATLRLDAQDKHWYADIDSYYNSNELVSVFILLSTSFSAQDECSASPQAA